MAAEWPAATRVCCECRTVVGDDGQCPSNARHRVADLERPSARAELVDTVWGPPSARKRAKAAAKSGAAGGAGGGVADCAGADCVSGCGSAGEVAHILLAIAIAALVAVVLVFLVRWLVRLWKKRAGRLRPEGAAAKGLRMAKTGSYRGQVLPTETANDPIAGEPCVAYGAQVEVPRGFRRDDIMLRVGQTIGFEIELDSGERLRVEPGLVHLDLNDAEIFEFDDARPLLFARLDPSGRGDEAHPPLVGERARVAFLRPGDRVELSASVEPRVAGASTGAEDRGPSNYREAAPSILVAVGTPQLRRLTD